MKLKRWLLVAALTIGMFVGLAGTALAANEHSSCVGLGSSWLGQQQQRDDIAHWLKSLGGPPGHLYSPFAHLHEGTFEACEAAENA